jgi:hypothetical protein
MDGNWGTEIGHGNWGQTTVSLCAKAQNRGLSPIVGLGKAVTFFVPKKSPTSPAGV